VDSKLASESVYKISTNSPHNCGAHRLRASKLIPCWLQECFPQSQTQIFSGMFQNVVCLCFVFVEFRTTTFRSLNVPTGFVLSRIFCNMLLVSLASQVFSHLSEHSSSPSFPAQFSLLVKDRCALRTFLSHLCF
jgi:hypothetical protein